MKTLTLLQIQTKLEKVFQKLDKDKKILESKAKALDLLGFLDYSNRNYLVATRLTETFKVFDYKILHNNYSPTEILATAIYVSQASDFNKLQRAIIRTFEFKKDLVVKIKSEAWLYEIQRYLDVKGSPFSEYDKDRVTHRYQNGKYEVRLESELYEYLYTLSIAKNRKVSVLRKSNDLIVPDKKD